MSHLSAAVTVRHALTPITIIGALIAAASAQPAPDLTPKSLRLFADTRRGHFGNPLPENVFPDTQRQQLGTVEFDKSAAGQKVRFSLRLAKTSAGLGRIAYSDEATIDREGKLHFTLPLARNWPIGAYDVVISRGGRELGVLSYLVKAAQSRATPIAVSAIRISRLTEVETLEPAPEPRPGDRSLRFTASTSGVRTEGATIGWTLSALDTDAGPDPDIYSTTIAQLPLDNSDLIFNVRLPRDWPTGLYRVQLTLDGAPLAAHEFRIDAGSPTAH
ncbi:hypothetical protein [Terrarubrum flagellatum]|uniref:hypothetical protein n=1 Tax=Terrirubrum flagellatum TaxID=2895980 RepID=UPI0031454083